MGDELAIGGIVSDALNPLYAKVVFALFWPLGNDMGYLKLKDFFQYSN